MYMGGTPLFDETTGESTDRYTYLKAKFPDEPWQKEGEGNETEKSDEMR